MMKGITKFLIIFLLFPLMLFSQVTTEGIYRYVENNDSIVLKDFETFFNVKIETDLQFLAADILEYSDDTSNIGKFAADDLIVISDNPNKFRGYTIKDVKKKDLKDLDPSCIFIKGVMIHEICHVYINELTHSDAEIRREFKRNNTYAAIFIEEGICEYASLAMGELVKVDYNYIPKTLEDLTSNEFYYDIKYEYSVVFVKKILDKYGLSTGTEILLRTKPPTDEELLKPELYYKRLNIF